MELLSEFEVLLVFDNKLTNIGVLAMIDACGGAGGKGLGAPSSGAREALPRFVTLSG